MQPVAVQTTDASVLITRGNAQLSKYLHVYLYKYSEGGGLSHPSSCEGGATALLAPPHFYTLDKRNVIVVIKIVAYVHGVLVLICSRLSS